VMTHKLREMMISMLNELKHLPERITDPPQHRGACRFACCRYWMDKLEEEAGETGSSN
jgi:hypothetical protein